MDDMTNGKTVEVPVIWLTFALTLAIALPVL
jgi:hypothetical protein